MVIKLEDDDYIRFLNDQTVNVEDDVMDPVYKLFLEHLRQDGKSYVLEMTNAESGLPAIVKYEKVEDNLSEDNLSENNEADVSTEGGDNPEVETAQKKSPLVDESYLRFLSHLRLNERSMMLEIDSVRIEYEEERETPTSLEISAPEGNVNVNADDEKGLVPFIEPSDVTVYEDGFDSSVALDSLDCYELTDFKSKLTAVLSRQFNRAEYDKLYKEANERKPLVKQKHLRSMSISYETNKKGQSYFDHFPDLKKQIDAADYERGLNLLRGFFFWLKNLCHEGAYMPWVSSGYELIAEDDCELVPPLDIARD